MPAGTEPSDPREEFVVYRETDWGGALSWLFNGGWRNARSPAIPRGVIERAPTAELAPGQTDQDSLPPYAELDDILHQFVDRDLSIADIVASGHDEDVVRKVAAMVLRNEYKRRQGAPGTRITSRGFGRDRRYPITSGWRESG